jgi:hypothetical protein
VKPPPFGLGKYFRGSTELCLFGIRGTVITRSTSIATHFEAPRGEHSEKPERFYEIVREASYPPYGEAFQRKARPDFVNLFVEAPAAPPPAAPAPPADDVPVDRREGRGMIDVRDTDRLDNEEIDRAVEGFFNAVAGMAMLTEGRAALLRVLPEHHDSVIARAIDKLQAKLPRASRRDVEAAIKRDFMRMFDLQTDGNA